MHYVKLPKLMMQTKNDEAHATEHVATLHLSTVDPIEDLAQSLFGNCKRTKSPRTLSITSICEDIDPYDRPGFKPVRARRKPQPSVGQHARYTVWPPPDADPFPLLDWNGLDNAGHHFLPHLHTTGQRLVRSRRPKGNHLQVAANHSRSPVAVVIVVEMIQP